MDRELCGLLARDRDVGQGWDTLENDVDSYGVAREHFASNPGINNKVSLL